MEPELPFRKVIIDSRNAVVGGSSENFIVSLPSTLQLPANTACYVLDVALSYGFYSIETDQNDKLYFWERLWNGSQGVTTVTTATLPAGSYTATLLAAAIQSAINSVSVFLATYTCSYEPNTNTILLSLAYSSPFPIYANYHGFTLLSKKMLADPGLQSRVICLQPNFNFSSIHDASGLLSLDGKDTFDDVELILYAFDNPNVGGSFPKTFRSGHIDVRSRHVLYLHSDALAGMRTIGPNGSRSVICRVPVSTTFGGLLFREHSSHPMDYIPVGGRTLTTIDVAVRDSFGQIVPLHGSHLSFELLFAPEPVA
jgi:hypothetical protein